MGTFEQEYWERRERKDAHMRKLIYSTGCGIITGLVSYYGATFVLPTWLVGPVCLFGFCLGAEASMYCLRSYRL
jgi:hypothetical protein